MATHWDSVNDWESLQEEEQDSSQETAPCNVGSYHCKSALRCHDSNMKLFLYKKSFLCLKALTGSSDYNEESLLLLPDLWRCFYERTHGLDRILSDHTSRAHSAGSYSFIRWADITMSEITTGTCIEETLLSEANIWPVRPQWLQKFQQSIYQPMIAKTKRILYLTYFLNLTLLVLNFRHNTRRPDIKIEIPGIIMIVEEDCYDVVFNEYFKVTIYLDGVRVRTPIYDQILQKDIYLNLCDKINERLNVIWGSGVISRVACFHKNDVENYDIHLHLIVCQIIQWGDNLLYSTLNKAFDLIGKYEAYCVSAILKSDNPMIWDNEEFQRNLLQDDMQNQPCLYPHAEALCAMLNELSAPLLAEIHGLWRIWGHPLIDLEGGMVKMETTCLKQQNVDNRETNIGIRTFKLTFAKNYFIKHSHYPLCNISDQISFDSYRGNLQARDIEAYECLRSEYRPDSYLHRCIREEKMIDEKDSHYVHEDWDLVTFLQNFQTPHSINLATMIKDKAISQTRSELVASVLTRNSVFDPTKRRGVLKWLTEQTIKLKDYLAGVDKNGLSDDDRIIGLYPKERELKRKARFFSLMSYNMRMFITATEEILGKYLLPYFPMITMSDTLLNMLIRLFDMTTNIGASNSKVTYSMNIDFSKWNQNMREKTNDGIFKSIDNIIGFRALISRTHNIFKTSYLYLCSGEYIPTIIRGMLTAVSPYSRIGDESGKEGLRQKGWTITTVCDIISLAFLHGVKIELIGGGDNQVLTVEIRSQGKNQNLSSEEQMTKIRERMNRFRNALAKKMEKRGLPLKLEETWISHRLLMYNKIMYLDGVPLPGRLKVISRLFSNSNEGISTLGNITSTLGTGFQALSSKDYDPTYTWIMSRILLFMNLGQYYMFSPVAGSKRLDQQILLTKSRRKEGLTPFGDDDLNRRKYKKDQLVSFSSAHTLSFVELYIICLYYHKILGGPGIGTPLAYIMKGFPDPLSEALTFNYKVLQYLKPTSTRFKMIDNLTAVNKSSVMHWEHLLEDPVSVNHDAPTHGVAALRAQAEQVLKNATIANVQFKELISIGDTEYLRELSEALCKPHDLEPRLLHDITGATVPGYVNTILSKVDQSSTISKLATNVDIISSVYENEVLYYIFLSSKIKIRSGHTRTSCSTNDARSLRNTTWGKNIIGVTTPHPSAFLHCQQHGGSLADCDQNYISVMIKRPHSSYKVDRGQFRPYFGSYTAEKFKTGVLASAYGDEDLLKRSLKIQKLLGWRYTKGTNMYKLIQSILSCVTDASPDKFLPTVEEITGDVEHRYHDMATKHGGIPTNLIKHYTYASCNTTTFVDHSKGAANETLHFQAAIIYCTMMGVISTLSDDQCTKIYHFHESCKTCVQSTVQADHEGEDLPSLSLASCPSNELMYVLEKDIPVHYHSHIAFLRAQNKKGRVSALADHDMVTFTEPKERISWLLLVAAVLAKERPTIKVSSMKLTLDSMDSSELIYIIRSIVHLHMMQQKVPTSCYDICDLEDVCQRHQKTLQEIQSTRVMSAYLEETGMISALIGAPLYEIVNELLLHPTDVIDQYLKEAVGKYQDPEYKNTCLLMMLAHNPSLKTCHICVSYAVQYLDGNDVPSCALHGDLVHNFRFHLYSLDKLSRFKGLPIMSENVVLTHKRKRTTLLDNIKMAKTNSNKRIARRRLAGFLYRTLPYEIVMRDYLCTAWSKLSVSMPEDIISDRLREDLVVSMMHDTEDEIPNEVGVVLRLTQCLLLVLSSLIVKETPLSMEQGDIILAMEINPTSDSVAIMRKSLVMLSTLVPTLTRRTVRINFVIADVVSLEDARLFHIEELVSSYNGMAIEEKQVRIIDNGDNQLDIMGSIDGVTAVISTSPSLVAYLSGQPIFMMTDGDHAYDIAREVEVSGRNSSVPYSWSIHQPTVSVVFPSLVVLCGTAGEKVSYISESLVIKSLADMVPRSDRLLCNQIISSSLMLGTSSLYQVLYHTLVPIKSGITTESTYTAILCRLGSGLHEFSLRSSPSESLPWRCITIIRMILAIRILTDVDVTEAMKFYSTLSSISYKRGTYRTIILHKRNLGPNSRGKLINWTKDSLGGGLVHAVQDIRKWLLISWSSPHPRHHSITI